MFNEAGNSNQPITVLNRWQKPGDNATVAPFLTWGYAAHVQMSEAWYSYDASYVRLKNVSISWQLPLAYVKKAGLRNARLFLHAQNLATITNYSGLDPETMSTTTLPPLRMITIGGQVEF